MDVLHIYEPLTAMNSLDYSKVLPLILRRGKTSRYQSAGTVGRLNYIRVLERANSFDEATHRLYGFHSRECVGGEQGFGVRVLAYLGHPL